MTSTSQPEPFGRLAWATVTSPAQAWPKLAGRLPWIEGLLLQWALLSTSALLAYPVYSELDRTFRGAQRAWPNAGEVFGLLLANALAVGLGNLLLASVLLGFCRVLGITSTLRGMLTVTAFGLLPLLLGQALGRLTLALAAPGPQDLATILGLHLRPFSAGLATWLVQPPPALTLAWSFLALADVFAMWSVWLIYLGLRRIAQPSNTVSPWLTVALMLVFTAAGFALWQAGQGWLEVAGRTPHAG